MVGAIWQQCEAVKKQEADPFSFLLYQPKTQPVEPAAHPTGLVRTVPACTPRAFSVHMEKTPCSLARLFPSRLSL